MATVGCRARSAAACAAFVVLAACAREGQDQMSWARTALERNAQIEIVAADPQSRTFTVRVKDSGELHIVRADQVVAGPAVSAAPAAASAAAPTPAAPAAPQAMSASVEASTAAPAREDEAASAAPAAAEAMPAPVSGGQVLKSGPGYSIEHAAGVAPTLMQSGPGYSIKAAPAPAGGVPARTRLASAGVTSAAVERRREPIVCQGERMLHIDNRNLEFEGDAVSAEDGCEIHITNSHISATGVGVLARHANVHIDNSLIEGDGGSIDASEGAQVYAASSHFRGLSRRLDSAAFHDLGGNIWN